MFYQLREFRPLGHSVGSPAFFVLPFRKSYQKIEVASYLIFFIDVQVSLTLACRNFPGTV